MLRVARAKKTPYNLIIVNKRVGVKGKNAKK